MTNGLSRLLCFFFVLPDGLLILFVGILVLFDWIPVFFFVGRIVCSPWARAFFFCMIGDAWIVVFTCVLFCPAGLIVFFFCCVEWIPYFFRKYCLLNKLLCFFDTKYFFC